MKQERTADLRLRNSVTKHGTYFAQKGGGRDKYDTRRRKVVLH